ncbi:MAG: dienelactone hydrolase family protein [Sedimentibacter sp.]
MDSISEKHKQAIVVLHEIYGINQFVKKQYQEFIEAGYDVFCPNMIDRASFSYEESIEAYDFFINNVGFEVYKEINDLVNQLKDKYDDVFNIGFSVGATIAWRCSENSLCSGIVACYGSRIRDYTNINLIYPSLLLFANEILLMFMHCLVNFKINNIYLSLSVMPNMVF